MNWNAAFERLMPLLKWIWYFVYVQFLFVLGTAIGAVVGGVFPAFYSSIIIAKEFARGDADYFATRRYFKVYRAIFWKSQAIGYCNAFIFAVCLSNIIYFNQLEATESWAYLLKMLWFIFTFFATASLLLVSPTFVDFKLKMRQLPQLLLAGLGDFRSILLIVFVAACIGLGLMYLTGFFIHLALGIFIFVIAATNATFERRKLEFAPVSLQPRQATTERLGKAS